MFKLKKWEIALICALALTLLLSPVLGQPCDAWWGAVYPDLTPDAAALSAFRAQTDGGVELRFRTLEWLNAALSALGVR
jgi:hypothetical protein